MMLILFIFPYIHNSGKTFRSLLWSSAASIYFIEMSFLLCLLLFGPHVSAQLTYPVLEMIRFIRIGGFLENLDPIVVAIWLSSLFVKISILLYIPVFITAQLFRLKDTRPLTFSFGAIMLGLSMHIVDNSIEHNQFLLHAWPTFALVMECLPLLYWIMSVIKKKRSNVKMSLGPGWAVSLPDGISRIHPAPFRLHVHMLVQMPSGGVGSYGD